MRLKFTAGRLKAYACAGISLKDGDITDDLPQAKTDQLLADFPDMFAPVEEESSQAEEPTVEADPAPETKKKSKGGR